MNNEKERLKVLSENQQKTYEFEYIKGVKLYDISGDYIFGSSQFANGRKQVQWVLSTGKVIASQHSDLNLKRINKSWHEDEERLSRGVFVIDKENKKHFAYGVSFEGTVYDAKKSIGLHWNMRLATKEECNNLYLGEK